MVAVKLAPDRTCLAHTREELESGGGAYLNTFKIEIAPRGAALIHTFVICEVCASELWEKLEEALCDIA
jgi:hypothetical protein